MGSITTGPSLDLGISMNPTEERIVPVPLVAQPIEATGPTTYGRARTQLERQRPELQREGRTPLGCKLLKDNTPGKREDC